MISFDKYLKDEREKLARILIYVLLALYIGNIVMVLFITPLTHIGGSENMGLHLTLALGVSTCLVAVPIYLLWVYPIWFISRHITAIAVGLECSLATALSGGQIELHFTFFIAMVFLSLTLDSKILWTFVVVVFLDHGMRGFIFPNSVYGCSMWRAESGTRPPLWLAAEHAGFVALQLLALLWFIHRRSKELTHLVITTTKLVNLEKVNTDQIVAHLNQDLLAAFELAGLAKIAAEKAAYEAIAKAKKVLK